VAPGQLYFGPGSMEKAQFPFKDILDGLDALKDVGTIQVPTMLPDFLLYF
jgi:hypothetical protein